MTGKLFVIAGPTAVGKGTVVNFIRQQESNLHLSISATTRAPRPGEVDGQSYFFISHEKFDQLISEDQMLEYAVVHGVNKYGTPRKPIEEALARGENVILEIDLQGARQVKQSMPEAVTIFIAPPNWDELVRRLTLRGTESADEQAKRLETARLELAAQSEFDHVVINDDVARCAAEVVELIQA
ncbi:MAG: guanylate kinase [Actinobacteria bacterium]|uniref:guanylate kinase n=1 Tax=freshwater metagenome TaxID=449393 RepID=A0A6J6HLZ6_9ZZZZ|nr:guanylate kinase [Actinomycetota bacterium]